jgi:hypothetical protein
MSKYLDRVSKLLNQAERAPEGSPEREAFMEKAVALAQANAIDLAVARSHQANKEKVEQIEERRIKVGEYRGTRVSQNTKWLAELLTEISPPNDVNCLISHDSMYVFLVGFPSDLEVVERLYASLAVQMVSEADRRIARDEHRRLEKVRRTKRVPNPDYVREGSWEWDELEPWEKEDPNIYRKTLDVPDDDEDGNPVYVEKYVGTDGRVWRQNFYQGFISRVTSRMWEERRKARQQAGVEDESSTAALALRDKDAERQADWDNRTKMVRGTYSGPEVSAPDWAGREEGQRVGARASLGREARVGESGRKELS